MRIILVGQAAFAQKTLQRLREKGEEVVAVFCPPDAPGGKTDPARELAVALGIPVYQPRSYKDPEVRERFVSLGADLAILAFVTRIVPLEIINTPWLGTICFHPSLLPRHRGGSAINWTLINGERRTGVTIFWTDAGIDTGPILLQKEAEVSPDDTAATLYYDKLFPLGIEAIAEAVALIEEGRAPRVAQDEALATYEPLCRDEHAAIEWSRPLQKVYDLIRGCDPQPGAYTRWRGKKVRLYDCRARPGGRGRRPGEVIEVGPGGFSVAARGGVVVVGRVRPEGTEKKIAASDFAATEEVRAGETLG